MVAKLLTKYEIALRCKICLLYFFCQFQKEMFEAVDIGGLVEHELKFRHEVTARSENGDIREPLRVDPMSDRLFVMLPSLANSCFIP